MKIDDALESLGNWGRYQTMIYILIFVASIPNAFIVMHFPISHYEPGHRCRLSEELEILMKNDTNQSETILDYFIPKEVDENNELRRSKCQMYNLTFSSYSSLSNLTEPSEIVPCHNGIIFDMQPNYDTAVTEFQMVCENDWKAPLAVTIFLVGMAVGSFSGTLADRFGRRPVFLWATLAQVISMAFAAISWDYYSYLVAMFLGGFTGLLNYIVAFVLATEVIEEKWRNPMAFTSLYSYSIGFCMVPLLGYILHNWRSYLWATTILSALMYLPNYWLFPESARWLLTMGRKEKARSELNNMAKMNNKNVDFCNLESEKEQSKFSGTVETLRIIFTSKLTSRCLASFFAWFVTCLVYFAIAYYSKTFSEDRYINILISALTEFPAYALGYYSLKWIGRPRSTMMFLVTCGITSILLPFIPKEHSVLITTISMVGKSAVTAEFYVVYLSTSEIVPTMQRSSSMSIASFCGRVGAFAGPFIMFMEKLNRYAPNLIMGTLSVVCGIVCIVYIPETKGIDLPDTTREAESNKRFYGFKILRKFSPTKKGDEEVKNLANETLL